MAGDQDSDSARTDTTIEQMAAEIDRLKRQLADSRFADELREALVLSSTTATVASPVSHDRLLAMILETAAHVINARAGALFIVDEEAQELIFEVALGQKADEVKRFRVPMGHGIAGLVAVSGQPMAISNAREDARQASDIAAQVDYKPDSILCVPLFFDDKVIGVLELLDKDGAPSFSPADMEALSLFAGQAAVAIEQSRTQVNVSSLMREVLVSVGGSETQQAWLQERGQTFSSHIEQDSRGYRHALILASLVQEIAAGGDQEVELCRTMLEACARYVRARKSSDQASEVHW